jgi:tRNA-dihydrouridine synthase
VADTIEGKAPAPEPGGEEKKRALLRHLELELRYREEKIVVFYMRRIAAWYFKGSAGVSEFRVRMNAAQSLAEVRQLIEDFKF